MLLHPLNDDADQAERPTTKKARGFAPVDPGTRPLCEFVIDGECCCAPAIACDLDSPRDPDERDDWPGFLCTEHYRRAEIEQWLAEIGAQVIQVKDLGAALEAGYCGSAAISMGTVDQDGRGHLHVVGCWPVCSKSLAARAAHLARVALGEA